MEPHDKSSLNNIPASRPNESDDNIASSPLPNPTTSQPNTPERLRRLSVYLLSIPIGDSVPQPQSQTSIPNQSPANKTETMSPGTGPSAEPEIEPKAGAEVAEDVSMADALTPPKVPDGLKADDEPTYGKDKFTRFELELEFVQCLANPSYLSHLANSTSPPYFTTPAFINYLSYLQYWSKPPYVQYLHYPGPTLKNLELLQLEDFRRDVGRPEVVARMIAEGIAMGKKGPGGKGKEKEKEGTGGAIGKEGGGGGEDGGVQGQSSSAQGTPSQP